ncbi:histidine triad nucleotide-binding protein [Prochlorococcus sp. MIT 1307]|uniref:histidine triad nucleotide-binding protein n=1 Tax=Prochlorococcus sp. MIT 1307 TaxID=3096219 RepID=UPI002A74DBFB|nr:histidine triad nucleotide-binding protein [Prochlorococcus sp. MIT 1307]
MAEETVFSKILKGDIPCEEVYRDNECLAFRDVQPQAPVHILVIPQKSIPSLREAETKDKKLLGHLLLVASTIANKEGLDSWRTVINTGASAGQTVFHLHVHIIGGRSLSWPPG